VTKSDLVAVVTLKLKLPHPRAELLIDLVLSSISNALTRGEGVFIRGFGTFSVREYSGYDGRNPRTGAIAHVRPKRRAFFKVGKELGERVGRGRDERNGTHT